MTTATTFSRQNDIGSRMSNTQYWENLLLVVVLVSESKALYHRIWKPPLSSVQTKRWRWHSDETSRPFQSHHLVSFSPQSQFLRGLLIFSVIRSFWKHFCFLIHIFSTVWIGTLRLLVAPTADTHKILSQTHHIFMEVWLSSYYFRLFFH